MISVTSGGVSRMIEEINSAELFPEKGLRPVASLGEMRWSSHPVCDALFQQYRGEQV